MDALAKVVISGLGHSIAQGFLIFSGALVLVAVWTQNFVSISFFTLFYALIAHYLTALRRHESLGECFVGSDKTQTVLFTLSYILFFVWWSTGVWVLLHPWYIVICWYAIFYISWLSFILALVLTSILFFRFFKRVPTTRQETYKVKRSCNNCDWNNEINIPKGTRVENHLCPNCNVVALGKEKNERQEKVEVNITAKRE